MCDYELEGDDLYSVKWYKGMSMYCIMCIPYWMYVKKKKNLFYSLFFFIPHFIHDRQKRIFSIHSKGNSFNKNISFSWYTGRCKLIPFNYFSYSLLRHFILLLRSNQKCLYFFYSRLLTAIISTFSWFVYRCKKMRHKNYFFLIYLNKDMNSYWIWRKKIKF